MKKATMLSVGAIALIGLAPLTAQADHKEFQGRTGLPTVREGKGNVWIERGNVVLDVRGSNLVVTQDFRLKYPAGKLEKGGDQIKVAVREDFFRSKDNGAEDVMESEARGFKSFGVWVDGRRVSTTSDAWMINDKKDTATRWRNWWVPFRPGQSHTMRIVSTSPLGWENNRRTVNFIAKDLGHWRDKPDNLEIRLRSPGATEARLVGVEPKPDDINRQGVRWVWRKADPNRDIFVILPGNATRRAAFR